MTSVTSLMLIEANIGTTADSDLPGLPAADSTARVFSAPRLRVVGREAQKGLRIASSSFSSIRLDRLDTVKGPLVIVELPVLTSLVLTRLRDVDGRVLVGGAGGVRLLECLLHGHHPGP